MSSDSSTTGVAPDEIDLLALLERAIAFFNVHKWIFIICTALGMLAGYLRYAALPTVYKSRLILQSIVLTNQNDIQIVSNWNAMLQSGDISTLAKVFNAPESTVKQLRQIKADEIQKIFTPNNPNGFVVQVYVTDVAALPAIQQGIIHGFDNADYVRERLASRRHRLEELIGKTTCEIGRLDSTKKMVENILAGRKASPAPLLVDVSSISRQLVDMNEKLLSYNEEIKFASSVQVLQGFTAFKKPAGPNLLVWLGIGGIAGFCLAYVIALFRSVSRSLTQRSQLRNKSA